MKKFLIITTINKKTRAIKQFSNLLTDWQIILIGDKKSKKIEDTENIIFLSLEDQEKLDFEIIKYLPSNHYARKNIGYLYAIKSGADIIYDTDDDNIPYDDWAFPEFETTSDCITSDQKFINIYKHYTKENIWPRGYPLDEVTKIQEIFTKQSRRVKIGAWQGLADIEPDVDAVYRLTVNKKIKFNNQTPSVLDRGIYCPFNSQNTLWRREVFSLLYLPSTVSFRFTDILRGYIAQRLFWENDYLLGFTKATVFQNRNNHNIMKDFEDEIPVYMQTKKLIEILDKSILTTDPLHNLRVVYKLLDKENIVTKKETEMIRAWTNDLNRTLIHHQ